MTTKEALCTVGDKIECNADSYRQLLEQNTEVTLVEKTDDGNIIVKIIKEP
jgi:hypothetical protein